MEKTYPELFKGLSDKNKEKVNEYIDSLYKKQKAGQEKQDTRRSGACWTGQGNTGRIR